MKRRPEKRTLRVLKPPSARARNASQLVPDEEGAPRADRDVGHVEGRPVPAPPVEIDEVDHVAVHRAVDEVAERSRADQRRGEAEKALAVVLPEHHEEPGHDGDGERAEQPALPAARVGQKRERGAAVVRENEVEGRSDGDRLPGIEPCLEVGLRGLVENDPKRGRHLSDKLHDEYCCRFKGTEQEVLFESANKDGKMFGYTGNYIKVERPYNEEFIGEIAKVRL